MTVLFSPIGTADPLTQLGDGPMLHIVRHCQPDKVVLFLSPDMAAYQKKDQRYTRAIELLSASLGRPAPRVEMIASDFDEVYRFDYYIDEFESILEGLSDEGASVLVNTSSGTAGMAQALVALGSFGRLDLELLQVTTPKKGVNARHDREDPDDFDLDEVWEWNKEACDNERCRICSVQTPNFSERLLKENIATLVKGFEYEAAYTLACQCASISEETRNLIRATADRMNLDGRLPTKVFASGELRYRANDPLWEYVYAMEVRLLQGHWADFVRAMSPALAAVMKKTLRPCLPDRAYLKYDKRDKPTDKRDCNKIRASARLSSILKSDYDSCLTNGEYMKLIEEYCAGKVEDLRLERIRKLRDAEKKGRNPLAHTLTISSKETIEGECGMTLEGILNRFFWFCGSPEPGLYRRINDAIISSL